jgi:hypothetical protein
VLTPVFSNAGGKLSSASNAAPYPFTRIFYICVVQPYASRLGKHTLSKIQASHTIWYVGDKQPAYSLFRAGCDPDTMEGDYKRACRQQCNHLENNDFCNDVYVVV